MEDKELQELFEAKRTVEANRRRQEELAAMIGRHASRTRPLWPVWTSAAAAAVVLLLLIRPLMKSPAGSEEPILVAKTDVPEVLPAPTQEGAATMVHTATQRVSQAMTVKTVQTEEAEEKEPETIDNNIEPIEIIDVEEAVPVPTVTVPADVAPTPRVMRRQSTLLACTEGCKAPEGTTDASSRNLQINFFSNENYADATIYSIPINK